MEVGGGGGGVRLSVFRPVRHTCIRTGIADTKRYQEREWNREVKRLYGERTGMKRCENGKKKYRNQIFFVVRFLFFFFFFFFFSSISVRSMRQCFPDRFRNLIIGLEQSNIEQSREESILDRTERQTSRVIEKWKKKEITQESWSSRRKSRKNSVVEFCPIVERISTKLYLIINCRKKREKKKILGYSCYIYD